MTKEQMLSIIRLLSAMESVSQVHTGHKLPDYLYDDLSNVIEMLCKELLK